MLPKFKSSKFCFIFLRRHADVQPPREADGGVAVLHAEPLLQRGARRGLRCALLCRRPRRQPRPRRTQPRSGGLSMPLVAAVARELPALCGGAPCVQRSVRPFCRLLGFPALPLHCPATGRTLICKGGQQASPQRRVQWGGVQWSQKGREHSGGALREDRDGISRERARVEQPARAAAGNPASTDREDDSVPILL